MASINLQELNQYVKNYYNTIELPALEAHHAARIREWFKENLSLIGTYGHRDFARFGSLNSIENDDDHFGRQDGWVSLTEEVPDIDHLTYGTGVLYIHGEMEIPKGKYKIAKDRDNIFGDEFYHVDRTGGTKHIYEDVVDFDWWKEEEDKGPMEGYSWSWQTETVTGTEGDGRWLYETINDVTGGKYWEEKLDAPSGNSATPTVFNDEEVYNVNNDRHHFPWIVINSSQIKSVKNFLRDWEGDNGMYDDNLPALAKDTYPPKKHGGIKFVKSGVDGILDYISPIDEVP